MSERTNMPVRPSGWTIVREIEIASSADAIWDKLVDLDNWGDWNPVYPRARGTCAQGNRFELTIALPGSPPRNMVAEVLLVSEGLALHFGASVMQGMLRAVRFTEIHSLGPDSCRVINGEVLSRPLAPILYLAARKAIGKGLSQQNQGLKQAVEHGA